MWGGGGNEGEGDKGGGDEGETGGQNLYLKYYC